MSYTTKHILYVAVMYIMSFCYSDYRFTSICQLKQAEVSRFYLPFLSYDLKMDVRLETVLFLKADPSAGSFIRPFSAASLLVIKVTVLILSCTASMFVVALVH